MNRYTNPQPPEGINTSPGHPIRTFFKLLLGMAAVLFTAAWLLGKSGGWLATLVPFSQEVRLSEAYPESELNSPTHPELRRYLDHLAERLMPGLGLPAGMTLKIHYQAEDVENAFATLGGNILLYKGLLKVLPHENSLAMLMAHEAAHVKLRHPIRSAGQNLAVSAGIRILLGYSDVDLLGSTGLYTQLHFSRAMETESDQHGLYALHRAYGHVAGATDLFRTLHSLTGEVDKGMGKAAAFFSTHPLDETRIATMEALAVGNAWRNNPEEITPLPADFMDWLDYQE